MINKKIFTLLLISCLFSSAKVGTAVYRWAEIESGARAIGMAGSQVASGYGISSLPYNPASISFIESNQIYAAKSSYLAGTSHNTLAFATALTPSDFLGVHLFYFDSGNMMETTELNPTGTGQNFKFTGLLLRLSYAKHLTDRLKLGGTFKYFNEQTTSADLSMSSVAFDIGSSFDTGIYGMTLGMCISNLGPDARYMGTGLDLPDDQDIQNKTDYFPIPLTFRVGLMNHIISSDSSSPVVMDDHRLSASIDAINPLDYDLNGSFGLEYAWNEMVFARFGSHLNHDTAGISFGFGLTYNKISLDFGYADYAILENTWQAGLSFEF